MSPLKAAAMDAISSLPDESDLDDILEEVIYQAKILQGMKDVREGRSKPMDQVFDAILDTK